MPKDYYKILGVEKNANDEEIKKSFRRLAHEHHPDKGGDPQKFKDINEAYQVLGDKQKRATYDQLGSAAFEQASAAGGFNGANGFGGFGFGGQGFDVNMEDLGDLGDMLGGMFGFSSRGGRSRSKQGHDIETEVRLSFLESIFGADKEIRIYKTTACSVCHGSGSDPEGKISSCQTCGGRGRVQQAQRTIFGVMNTVVACPDCQGTGQRIEKPCKHCSGTGMEKLERTLKIKVPAGMSEGEALHLPSEGEFPGRGGRAGDLYIRIRVAAHPVFSRDDHEILSTVLIPYSILALGGTVDVDTVDGKVDLKIPAGTVAGTTFKLKGKGVPYSNGKNRGDHLVKVMPDIPNKLTREQKKLLEDLGKLGL
ncbi:MAG: molecular chaperone DnaJ [Patescibacteria group bacterium]|nr:molecular chaperone DnaJ [Patescibacteria group bacterium]